MPSLNEARDAPSATYYREVDARQPNGEPCISRIEYWVVRETPRGCWVSPTWDRDGHHAKFVLEGLGRRFAYPTPALARESYIIRKRKEIQHCANQHDKAVTLLAAALAGAPPMPEYAKFVLSDLVK